MACRRQQRRQSGKSSLEADYRRAPVQRSLSVEFLWPELGEHNIPVWGCTSPWVVCATKPRTGGVRFRLTGRRGGTCSDSASRRPFWAGSAERGRGCPPPLGCTGTSPAPASFPPLLTKCTSPLYLKPQDQPYAIGPHPSSSADPEHTAGGSQHVTELAGGTPARCRGRGGPGAEEDQSPSSISIRSLLTSSCCEV